MDDKSNQEHGSEHDKVTESNIKSNVEIKSESSTDVIPVKLSAPETVNSDTPEALLNNPIKSPITPVVTKPEKANFFKKYFRPELIFPKSIRNKLGKFAMPVASLLIALVIGGAAYAAVALTSNNATPGLSQAKIDALIVPVKPFAVVTTTPTNAETNVSDNSKIVITFNQPVNANKLQNAFIVTPTMKGNVTQGSNAEQVIYTPDVPFSDSTDVKIMIDNSFQSQLGQELKADYLLGFTTQIPDDGVDFQDQGDLVRLASAQSSTNVPFTLNVGTQVSSSGQIVIYKSDVNTLLTSLEYQKATDPSGYTYDQSNYDSVDTSGMQQVSTSNGLTDQSTFNVKEPNGIYFVAAISNGKQVGWTWVVFNDNGTVMRQDYNQIILSSFNLSNNTVPSNENVTFYNLDKSVTTLKQTTLQSPQSYKFPYTPQVDVAVVTDGQDTMVVPISVPDSLADTRVTADLSQTRSFYAVTDKPTYQVNSTVSFAGYVRLDNDAQFTTDSENNVKLYLASQDDPTTPLQSFNVPLGANGQFDGQFTLTSSLASKPDLAIYGYTDMANTNQVSIASFSVATAAPQYNLNISFSKPSYLANQPVNAIITATQSNGQPLANTAVTYNIYSKPYYENNPTSNLNSFDSTGTQIGAQDQTAQLNGNGQATVNINTSQLQLLTQGSQVVTVQASKTDNSGNVGGGGASAIVHQGNMVISFGTGKSYFATNDTRFARIYVTDLNNAPLANTTVNYQFVTYTYNNSTQEDVPTTVASGSGVTDNNGYLEVSQQLNTTQDVTIIATTADSFGNQVTAQKYTYTTQQSQPEMAGADNLDYLDVSGSNGTVNVGETVPLTITAPQNLNVLVSTERGQIYTYQTLQLNKGTNTYNLDVTNQLYPSFNLVFSYFVDGEYHTEGTMFTVNNPAKELNVSISPDQASYNNNQTANITIHTTTNEGVAVPTNMIVAVESDSMFNLGTSFEPDMYSYYYATREYSTNSSSSLTGVGSGGGKCGGGGFANTGLLSNAGTTLYWNPNLTTNSQGTTTFSVALPTGTWHILAYAMSSDALVGSTQSTVVSQ